VGLKNLSWGGASWLALVCLALAADRVGAEQQLYSLEIPGGQAATFEVPFSVDYPGEITVVAEWTGNRPLSFRIEPPNQDGVALRRSGPSPVRLRMDVQPNQLKQGSWTLIIHALPLSEPGDGRLTINLPDPPTLSTAQPEPTEPTREPWQKPRPMAKGLTQEQSRMALSTESFRKLLVETGERPPDTCRWQDDLLQWLAAQRDLALDDSVEPDAQTGKLINDMVDVIRAVDEMRQSRDPALVGPPPDKSNQRARWERSRTTQLRPMVRNLDELMNAVQRDHAPQLQGQRWPLRMVSCLTATQRYFEQRWVAGADMAPNRELAEAQWRPLNRAATALEALAGLASEDVIRLRSRN
jgi:hypothetical protein